MPNLPPKASMTKKGQKKDKPFRYSQYNKDDIIYSRQWKKLRECYLSQYPVCQRCIYHENTSAQSLIRISVHHIKRRNVYKDLAFDEDNLLALCERCHGYLSGLESSGRIKQAEEQGTTIKRFFD